MTYHDLIARNRRNSALLVVGFVLFVGAVVGVLGAAAAAVPAEQAAWLALWATAGAAALAAWSYYRGDRAILRMSGARPVSKQQDPELFNVVEEMAIAAGVPVPETWLI